MHAKTVAVLILLMVLSTCDAISTDENEIEARGKKKKIALFGKLFKILVSQLFVCGSWHDAVFWRFWLHTVLHLANLVFNLTYSLLT